MTNIGQIKKLLKSSDVANTFFERLATRIKNYSVTTVDQAIRIADAERRDVIEMFRQMEELGLGVFIVGRRTGVSRFEWHVRMVDTAKDVFAKQDDAPVKVLGDEELVKLEAPPEEEEEEDDPDSTQHSFVLRRDLTITFKLPSDLTSQEADRLSKFVLTLPLED